MLKLMIVDDEAVIRTGIRTCLNWESMKIDVVGEAGNGRDALSRALLLAPDIVITDIKMPIINGIEFSRRLFVKAGSCTGFGENDSKAVYGNHAGTKRYAQRKCGKTTIDSKASDFARRLPEPFYGKPAFRDKFFQGGK